MITENKKILEIGLRVLEDHENARVACLVDCAVGRRVCWRRRQMAHVARADAHAAHQNPRAENVLETAAIPRVAIVKRVSLHMSDGRSGSRLLALC